MPKLNRTVNVIKKMTLVEVSVVSVPANPEARAVGWYVSKALEANDQKPQGGIPMPEEQVVIEELRPEAGDPPQSAAPAAEAPKPEAAKPEPAPQPAEVSKSAPPKTEPVRAILDKIAALGGQAGSLAEQVKVLLATEPAPAAAPPQPAPKTVGRDDLSKMMLWGGWPGRSRPPSRRSTLRKGLVQPDVEQDDVRNSSRA